MDLIKNHCCLSLTGSPILIRCGFEWIRVEAHIDTLLVQKTTDLRLGTYIQNQHGLVQVEWPVLPPSVRSVVVESSLAQIACLSCPDPNITIFVVHGSQTFIPFESLFVIRDPKV